MDFVAVKTKRPQNIEIVGSSHIFCNPKMILDGEKDETFAIDKLCACEASEYSEELPKQTIPSDVPFMKKRVQLQQFSNPRQTKLDAFT